jgi:MoxR-like ATPase
MTTTVAELVRHVRGELGKVIVGQREPLDQLLVVLLAGGHALLEGAPGLAKTLAVKALAHIFQMRFQRVQCTPDLMPADVLGGNIFNQATGSFTLHRGPIFTDLLLVDEINRTPPRTQSALLEAMEERQVTIDGTSHPLSGFFSVFATQNPIEFEGTYPLPEAQLDRFLLKIRISYPEADQETRILQNFQEGFDPHALDRAGLAPLPAAALRTAREEVHRVGVEPALYDYITAIVRRTRNWPAVNLGASPRAAINLMFVAKAIAATEGRDFLIPDDVKAAAPGALRHRLILKAEADLEGVTADQVVSEVLTAVPVPQ